MEKIHPYQERRRLLYSRGWLGDDRKNRALMTVLEHHVSPASLGDEDQIIPFLA